MTIKIRNTLAAAALAVVFSSPSLAQWSHRTLPTPRAGCGVAAANGKVYVAGGWDQAGVISDVVDVYDEATDTWSVLTMPGARWMIGATSTGNLVYFGAGMDPSYNYTGEVFIYDSVADTWTTYVMGVGRIDTGFVAVGQKLFVAGGNQPYPAGPTDVVDIFDAATSTWSTTILFEAMGEVAATTDGTWAYFAGGRDTNAWYSDRIQAIDPVNGTSTSVGFLAGGRVGIAAATVGTKSYFIGGIDIPYTCADEVDVYDSSTATVTSFTLPVGIYSGSAAVLGNTIFVGGGYEGDMYNPTPSSRVYLIDGPTGSVTQTTFPGGITMDMSGTVSTGAAVYFVGNTAGDVFIYGADLGNTYCFGDGAGTPCPCGNNNNGSAGGCDWGSPSFPGGAVLDGTGTDSMAANDAYLVAIGVENDFGIFFGANNAVNGGNGNPLNDGLRCAGGALVRLIPPTMATGNQATTPMPIQALDTGAAAGVTRRYQYWFRTPGGPCAQMANLTNGYEIVWGV